MDTLLIILLLCFVIFRPLRLILYGLLLLALIAGGLLCFFGSFVLFFINPAWAVASLIIGIVLLMIVVGLDNHNYNT